MRKQGVERSATIGFWVLVLDRLAGRRDGRMGLPIADAPRMSPTPRLESIRRQCEARVDVIRQSLIRDDMDDCLWEVEIEEHLLPLAQERRAAAQHHLDSLRGRKVEPSRQLGEDDLPDELVQRRRAASARKELDTALVELDAASSEVHRLRGELHGTRARRRQRADHALKEERRVHRWAGQRENAYLDGVKGKHPDRALLSTRLKEIQTPPAASDAWQPEPEPEMETT